MRPIGFSTGALAKGDFVRGLDLQRRHGQIRAIELSLVVDLNRLRCRVERWTDMLLAHLASYIAIDEFAFEPARARDFNRSGEKTRSVSSTKAVTFAGS